MRKRLVVIDGEMPEEAKREIVQRRSRRELEAYRKARAKRHVINPRHADPTKAEKRLAARQRDYDSMKGKPGYHRPGSMQK